MGAYNQGGGGGRAVDFTENDQFAFDQPFEIGSTFTAETAQQINDMFRILFKSQRRAEDKTIELEGLIVPADGTVLSVSRDITEAELEAANATPIELVAAPGLETAIIPILLSIKTLPTAAYSSAPNWRIRHAGIAVDLTTVIPSGLTATNTRWGVALGDGTGLIINSVVTTIENLGLELSLSAAPGTPGTGVATAQVQLWYTTWDLT